MSYLAIVYPWVVCWEEVVLSYLYIYMRVFMCVHVCMYVCMNEYVYIYVYIYVLIEGKFAAVYQGRLVSGVDGIIHTIDVAVKMFQYKATIQV